MSHSTSLTDKSVFSRVMQQNPLGMGLAALSLGALVGLLLPATEPENKLMGGTRDQLMDKAHETLGELRNKVGVIAGVAQSAAHDALDTVKDSASEALSTAKDSVVEEVKHQGLAPEQK